MKSPRTPTVSSDSAVAEKHFSLAAGLGLNAWQDDGKMTENRALQVFPGQMQAVLRSGINTGKNR